MHKVIHTSDWHLGQKLDGFDRTDEHQNFLNWLLTLIREENVEGLLVCGDIFDSANPPVSAIRQFTEFVVSARHHCPNIALIAGNHDSAGRLDSLQPLLHALGISSIGYLPKDISDGIVSFKDRSNKIFAKIACIPYLRPFDFPGVYGEEASDETLHRIIHRTAWVYQRACDELCNKRSNNEVLMMTGHLFIQGAQPTEGERSIQFESGKLIGIPSSIFNSPIDYVALGHLHRGQQIHGAIPIYYSGAPIPLSFAEVDYSHHIQLITISDTHQIVNIEPVFIPQTVKIADITGTFDDVQSELYQLVKAYPSKNHTGAIVRVNVMMEHPIPSLRQQLLDCVANSGVNILSIRRLGNSQPNPNLTDQTLDEFLPIDIFRLKYQTDYACNPPPELESAFIEIFDSIMTTLNENL